ncbi:hypothetical protein RHMOL_Rhmol02G0007400 [Rhododendron molle]|uniref:Uncharacterized protein n=1 Tax=Rhododendron molle TaxID=49168 RepID=A0ACC0PLP0_RHOML|nr:hypothetical protein RHMOL_Rhmol02G0007400 [Rhododendron molle]
MEIQDPPKTKSRIKVNFPKDHLKRIRQQYKGCFIIKLLGRNIGFKTLMTRITALWNLEGLFTPVDLGLGFYLIRFESRSDYNKVYTGGPWVIQDHYLTVKKWQPDFKADKATAITTAVWMRFPFLPYEYYDEESLFTIAKELGKPLKVDINTIAGIRASYARVCVELDLSQPLEVSVAIRNEDYLIEYEHIHLICFECGRVGHRKESCSFKPTQNSSGAGEQTTVAIPERTVPKSVSFNGNTVPEVSEDIGYGEWMVVSRRRERKNGPMGHGPRRIPNNKEKSAAHSGGELNNRTNSNLSQQYKPRNPTENGAGPSRQTYVNHSKENRSKTTNSASVKESKQQSHRYEDNPLLRKPKSANQPNPLSEVGSKAQREEYSSRPTVSPVSHMEVVLEVPNPNSSSNSTPPPSENLIPTPLRKPPDIATYHEFARASECNRELPQGEHGDRFRHRSRSPHKSGLVARRAEVQSQTLESSIVEDSQSHRISEAAGAARTSQGEDSQALGTA